MATLVPSAPAPAPAAPAPRRGRPAIRALAAAVAGLALAAAVGAAGHRAVPLGPSPSSGADACVSPAAGATVAAWPPVAAPVGDADEARGERRPDALVVPAEFRAFQACRQRTGG
jgi:hypothetical protein